MIGIKEVFMKTYTDVPRNNTNGLSDISVISIHEDKRGRLWLGTDGGGINQYDSYTDTFKHYPSTYGDKVVSITDYSDSELLVSLYTKGMYLFNKETGNYHRPFYLIDEATTVDQFHGEMPHWLIGLPTNGLIFWVKMQSAIVSGPVSSLS